MSIVLTGIFLLMLLGLVLNVWDRATRNRARVHVTVTVVHTHEHTLNDGDSTR